MLVLVLVLVRFEDVAIMHAYVHCFWGDEELSSPAFVDLGGVTVGTHISVVGPGRDFSMARQGVDMDRCVCVVAIGLFGWWG